MADVVRVYTFKAGLLSRVAHDLCLEVGEFSIERGEGGSVRAEFDPSSLSVRGVMRGERLDSRALSRSDQAKIVETIRRELLHTRRHPIVTFVGTAEERESRLRVKGDLELAGRRRPLAFTLARQGDRLHARVTLQPSEFGIAPYKALAGAIRLQDRVVVELDLAAE